MNRKWTFLCFKPSGFSFLSWNYSSRYQDPGSIFLFTSEDRTFISKHTSWNKMASPTREAFIPEMKAGKMLVVLFVSLCFLIMSWVTSTVSHSVKFTDGIHIRKRLMVFDAEMFLQLVLLLSDRRELIREANHFYRDGSYNVYHSVDEKRETRMI